MEHGYSHHGVNILRIHGERKKYPTGTTYRTIAEEYQKEYANDIVLVRHGDHLRELEKKVCEDGSLEFVTTADRAGRSAYRRSMTFLMETAAESIFSGMYIVVQHSVGQGYYCEFCRRQDRALVSPDPAWLPALKKEMSALVQKNLPIQKYNLSIHDAISFFEKNGYAEKARLLHYRRSSRVNIYELEGYPGYYYGHMVPSTGYLRYFDLLPYQNGFMLMFPDKDTKKVAEFQPLDKLFQTMDEAAVWGRSMGVSSIGELNEVIASGKIQDLILIQEAWMEQRIGKIAEQIAADPGKKFVLIAGPSSSGKTTFSHRLAIQLAVQGLKPHTISLDDFYVNREETPKDESGEFDFECLEAIDIPLFNRCLNRLLEGREVTIPSFNFRTGRREYQGRRLKMGETDVLLIEGIHGLNEKLSCQIPKENKFKIYISALTQLNIDEQNNLSTTDGRLIRRIVRDARSRNTTSAETLTRWDSVRRGEEKNIFPYQEEADVMFNSALIYELAVLKVYAEPLLFSIPQHEEAKRLLKILDCTLPAPAESIGPNSILREFIGGGCFGV